MKSIAKLLAVLFSIALVLFGLFKGYKLVQKSIYPLKYTELIEKYGEKYGVDEYLICAVIKCESGYDSAAVSNVGAKGLMQMTDDTFEWLQNKEGSSIIMTSDSLFDPETSIRYGVYFLSLTLEKFENETAAVAAYHAGMTSVSNWLSDSNYSADGATLDDIPYSDTKAYVERVLKVRNTYEALYGDENE